MTAPASPGPHVVDARSVADQVAGLRAGFRSGRTRSIEWRLNQLAAIVRMVAEHEADFARALGTDLGRSPGAAWFADLMVVTAEAKYALRHLRSWLKPTRVATPLGLKPARAWYEPEPLGVVLIIGPWNYPIQLILAPLIGALAAGNCAVLKPSEQAPACSAVLAELVPEYLDAEAVRVVEGDAQTTQLLLDQGFDHCLFTGSPEVGKAIMAAAAKHLTPVTLELGGKSPVIVTRDADLSVAARRIAWAKLLNSGQTCVAPDYVLVDREVRAELVAKLIGAARALGNDARLPIVNARHADRIAELVDQAGGDIVYGGAVDVRAEQAQLTVVVDPDAESGLMREEIFGPVLPVVTVDSVDDAIAHVQQGPKPLAVYLFSASRATERRILDEISNGGTVINHLAYHVGVPQLPFGGVGHSGSGAYHGKWGFDTFSHRKAVLRKPTWFDPALGYPPYTRLKRLVLRRLF
jgi:aldehyde dehydrogenase (NAD+)